MANCKPHLSLAVMQYFPPWNVFKNDGSEIGIITEMLREAANSVNFTYSILFPKKGEGWGKLKPDGNWTGMIGMLLRDEADIIINPLAITEKRQKYVDLSVPFYGGCLAIISGVRQSPQSVFRILDTFDQNVWLAILVSLLLLVTTATVFEVRGYVVNKSNNPNFLMTWALYFLDFLAVFFSEATPRYPTTKLAKFLIILWCFSMLVTMNSFSGQFTGTLTFSKAWNIIDSVEDLAKTVGKLRIITWKGSFTEQFIRGSEQIATMRVKKIIEQSDGFVSVREMYTRRNYENLISGKLAMIADDTSAKYFVGEMCQVGNGGNVHFAKENLLPIHLSWATKKNLDRKLKQSINKVLFRLRESGLIEKWMADMYKEYQRCQNRGRDKPVGKPMTFHDTRAAYTLWSLFSLLSVAAFLVEMFRK